MQLSEIYIVWFAVDGLKCITFDFFLQPKTTAPPMVVSEKTININQF